jgi:hypothetical protein
MLIIIIKKARFVKRALSNILKYVTDSIYRIIAQVLNTASCFAVPTP